MTSTAHGLDDAGAVELLHDMVRTPSLSREERPLAEFLVARMRALGLNSAIDNAGNAVGATRGDPLRSEPGVADLVLLGHMDVVPGTPPVRIEGDLLYGRGSVDAKGPLAAFIAGASRASLPEGVRVVVIGAVEEEIATSAGARAVRERYTPRACIIGEPSAWDGVTIAYKGRVLVRYSLARGISHTAGPAPSVGDEVVRWWSGVCAKVAELNAGRAGNFQQLQATLRSVHTTSDGLRDHAHAVASFRLPPWAEGAAVRAMCREFARDAEVSFDGEEETIVADRASPVARALTGAIRAEGGRPALVMKSGTSDMNVVAARGWWTCPIAAYGPGDSALDHTPDEHVRLSEYLRAVRVLSRALETLAGEVAGA